MKSNKFSIFAITLSGIMIALCVIVKLFTPYFPIAGAMVLRLDFYGAFEKLPAVLFGPIVGGIVGALVDFVGYLFANKTATGYIFLLTITAFLNCFIFALLWKQLKDVSTTTLKWVYGIIAGIVLVSGIIAYVVLQQEKSNWLYDYLMSLGEKSDYLPLGLILTGALAIVLLVVSLMVEKYTEKLYMTEHFLNLFVALIIPGVLMTIANTFILRAVIDGLGSIPIMVFLIPRVGGQIMETLIETYILGTIISIAHPFLKKKELI